MEKEPMKLLLRLTPWIFLLVIPLLYLDIMWSDHIHFQQSLHYPHTETAVSGDRKLYVAGNGSSDEFPDSLDSILSRLVQGEEQRSFRATGFSCDAKRHSKHCVTNRATRIDTSTMTVTILSGDHPVRTTSLRPYARQEDEILLQKVTPVTIIHGNATAEAPPCDYVHGVPAVVFSASGFTGNVFHEINEIIIPLFITTALFRTRAVLVVEDYRLSFVEKYGKILSQLTSYEIVDAAANRSVHCFPAAVVGLKFHNHLSLNSSDIPGGLSTPIFREFLRRSLNLKHRHVSEIKIPTVMLLSRTTTRRIINEDEVAAMMKDLGFRVIVVSRAKVIANLNLFSSMINACSVFVGAHGAGLTNELFLPDGAVMVQVDLIGLEWAAATYYGEPARGMGVHYLRYKIEAEESSLLRVFGSKGHKAFVDPRGAFPAEAGKQVYLNGQNVNIDVDRFRRTMAMAMSLVQDSSL